MKRAAVLLLSAVLGVACPRAVAGEPVKVSVTSVSGRSVFLDRGKAAGITPGLPVRLFPPGAAPIDAVIADVSTNSSRIELPAGFTLPPIGCTGELDVPDAPKVEEPADDKTKPPPEHAPWTRQEGGRSPDEPLLAPAFSKPPSERASTFHGRAFAQFQYNWDKAEGRDNSYLLARAGTAMELTNPLGRGGRFQFDAEVDVRSFKSQFTGTRTEEKFILDRLSYTEGGEEYSPYRLEVGRFTSIFLPEMGIIDGVEGVIQLEGGMKYGAGFGAYPLDFPDRKWGDDLGFHVFMDYQSPGEHRFNGTLGYQKTWHEGAPDRDAIFGRFNIMPTRAVWLYGSATIDVYGQGNAMKSSGPHLTQAWLQARYAPDSTGGVSVSYSHYTWPDLKRNDFGFSPVELIRDGQLDRVELSAWHDLVKDVRVTGRVNYFTDQGGNGTGGELDGDWDQVLGAPVSLHADVFYSNGSFTDGTGFRVEVRPGSGEVQGFVGYEYFRYNTTGLATGTESAARQTLRAGLNWQIDRWSYSLTADHYFGNGEDAYSLGMYLGYRF